MEEAPENGKESPYSVRANGLFINILTLAHVPHSNFYCSPPAKTRLDTPYSLFITTGPLPIEEHFPHPYWSHETLFWPWYLPSVQYHFSYCYPYFNCVALYWAKSCCHLIHPKQSDSKAQ